MGAGTSFKDGRGRDWTVRITGATIEEAAARGIDLSADFVKGVVAAIRATMAAGEGDSDERRQAEGKALLELGSAVLSLRLIGTLISLCWLGCRHSARVVADKVTELDFKESLHGKSLREAAIAAFNALSECFDLPLQLGAGDEDQGADPTDAGDSGKGRKGKRRK